jgi:Kdo2-lipid IVA lauroyltransferase/acyltransferase
VTDGDGGGRRPTLAHRAEFMLFRALRVVVSVVPQRLAVAVAMVLGAVAGSVLRVRRADVDRHLEWAFPDWDRRRRDRVARASYRHLAREAVMLFRLGGWSQDRVRECTEVLGLDAVRAGVEERGGALLLTGHLGNWEVGGAAMAARGVPIDVVAKGMANPDFERELFGTRERLGMRVVEMGDAPRRVLRALRRGRVVAIVGDQNAHRNGVFVPFFGRLAASARGPATFALRADVPVFVGFGVRRPGRRQMYRIRLEPLIVERTGDFDHDLEAFTAAYMAAVEDAARAHPEQYFWQHKRWKTRPVQEPVGADPVEDDER